MTSCPVCLRNMFHTVFQDPEEYICPVHGSFLQCEINLSPTYHKFKSAINNIRWLDGAITSFVNEERKSEYNSHLLQLGYNDYEKILNEKGDIIATEIQKAKLILLKVEIEKYAKDCNYKNVKEMVDKNKNIINKNIIKIKSKKLPYKSLDILGNARDLIVHPKRDKNKEKNSDIIDNLQNDMPDKNDIYSFLKETVIIKNDDLFEPIFTRGLSKQQLQQEMLDQPRINYRKSSMKTYGEYIIDGVVKVIMEIELERYNIPKIKKDKTINIYK